jgi:hypothetical protein
MQIIVVQSGLYVTAIATTIIGIHTYYYNRHTYILLYALNLIYLYSYCYVYMHACATAKL